MNVYEEVLEILLEKTPFIIEKQESEDDPQLYLFQDTNDETAFARVQIRGTRMVIAVDEFVDWRSVHHLLRAGKHLIHSETHFPYEKVILEYYFSDMDKEFIYEYRLDRIPWYMKFGFLPYYTKWGSKRIKTWYQLPFVKPDSFLDLPYGKELICPRRIIYQKQSNLPLLSAQKDPTLLELRTLPRTCFYSVSKRPINSMNLLRQDRFQVLDLSKVDAQILKSGAPFAIDGQYYIPVVRYALGMRNGCYFDPNPNKKWLGTFYYWEPESQCYLRMGAKFKFGYFETKLQCALELMEQMEDKNDLLKSLEGNIKVVFDEWKENFYKHYEEEAMEFENRIHKANEQDEDLETILMTDWKRLYCGKETKFLPIDRTYASILNAVYMKEVFYASEDALDQDVAKCLIECGYDVAIFGRMAGSYRVVSEVLDVRSREKSLSELCWTCA